jgi:hypothetical protein
MGKAGQLLPCEILISFLGKQGYGLLPDNFPGNKMKNMKVNGSYVLNNRFCNLLLTLSQHTKAENNLTVLQAFIFFLR